MRIIGADSETLFGEPMTFQFFGDDCPKTGIIQWVKPKKATEQFLKILESVIRGGDNIQTIVFVHNLTFDMISFLFDRHEILKNEEFSFDYHGWHVEGIYAGVVFATLTRGKYTVRLVDTFAYFQTSLAKLALVFCPDLPKLPKIKNLGSVMFEKTDKNFIAYAMRDAEIAYHIGKAIVKMHQHYRINISVSAPHMASQVFRRTFLSRSIPLPEKRIVYAALSSYHGGKNNLAAAPGWYENIYSLDIISAYPDRMARLPSFSCKNLYKEIFGNADTLSIPDLGIYRVWGTTKNCKWPSLFDHKFKPIIGRVEAIWVTGFELNESIRSKEFVLTQFNGFYYDADADIYPSPFKAYVEEFFKLKSQSKDASQTMFYKILMNSLYGKLIQTIDNDGLKAFRDLVFDLENDSLRSTKTIIAGGMFNPFIASMITGSVRAHIHRMEHKYKALHTATDGIFTLIKPKETKGLGGEKIDCEGDLLLFRNKCYIIYGDLAQATVHARRIGKDISELLKSKQYKGKYILKYAHHGFYGTVYDMERMQAGGIHEYSYTKANKLKESLKRGLKVNNFEKRKATFNY